MKKVLRYIKKLTNFFIISTVLLIICILGIWYYYQYWVIYKPLMQSEFNSYKWKQVALDKDENGLVKNLEVRCGMYHDLTRNYLKKGMSINEVENLLGKINSWVYCKNDKVKCGYNVMGVCYSNSLSIIPMNLYTCFDRMDKLITYDREIHCKSRGSYDTDTKQQYCSKMDYTKGIAIISNECGIKPW